MRRCLFDPIPEIFNAAEKLSGALDLHLNGDHEAAERLIAEANDPVIWSYTDIAWGRGAKDRYGFIAVENSPPHFDILDRPTPRMPDKKTMGQIVARDGYHCRFCGIPVIDPAIRKRVQSLYPKAVQWGRTNATQHAAFQCMWLQYDHILPNSRGGASTLENVVVTCAPCNFARMEATLEEARLENPLANAQSTHWVGYETWNGLTGFLKNE